MSKKSHIFYNQLSAGWVYSAFGNVCRALYSMYLYHRCGNRIVPALTQLDLAAFLGIHRSSLHKILVRLRDEGVIGVYSRKTLNVHKPDQLRGYALESAEA